MRNKTINEAISYIKTLFSERADGHDVDHTLRVHRNAMRIAENELGCVNLIVELAALLHDVDDHKLFHTENNQNARYFLEKQGISPDMIDDICRVIQSVSFSKNRGKNPETIEGRIVQDADRLDAMGAIGIARTFAYGGEKGRMLDDSIKHFHEKLLLLKDEMNTETGKQMAESRHAFLERFLLEYEREKAESKNED